MLVQETADWIAAYPKGNPAVGPLPAPRDGETLDAYRVRLWGSPDGVVPLPVQ